MRTAHLLLPLLLPIVAAYVAAPLPTRRAVAASSRVARDATAMAGFGAAPAKKPHDPFKKPKEAKKIFEAAMNRFNALREPRPFANQVDVYVKADDEKSNKFWYVGKSVARTGSTDDVALGALAQKRLVFEHAKLLQRELKSAKRLQLWVAPPNSEVRVAQHQVPLRGLTTGEVKLDASVLGEDDVGFLPEQYTVEDQNAHQNGFFVRLPPDGIPVEANNVRVVPPEELESMNIQSLK